MPVVFLSSAVTGLALLAGPGAGPDGKAASAATPYAGFGPGSWVTLRTVSSAGPSVLREVQEKRVIERIEAGSAVVSFYTLQEGRFELQRTTAVPPARDPRDLPVVGGKDETLTIGGTAYPCRRTDYVLEDDADRSKITCMLWTTPQIQVPVRILESPAIELALPPDVVRVEFIYESPALRTTASMVVVTPAAAVLAGSRRVSCVAEQCDRMEFRGSERSKATIRTWLSAAVPGHVVRREIEASSGRSSRRVVEEVVDFLTVPATAGGDERP